MAIEVNLRENDGTLDPSAHVIRGRSANAIIRELIFDATKNGTNISHVYRETLRSIIELFNRFSIIDSQDKVIKVKGIHANPDRSVAVQVWEDNLILPIISISQLDTVSNIDRSGYSPKVVDQAVWDDKKQRAVRVVSLSPRPIDIEYKVTVWAKYKADLDQLTEQVCLNFNPGHELQTDISNNTKAFLANISDASEVNTADREDRILKRVFTIEVQTYVPSPKFLFTSTGKIERFEADVTLS